MTKNGRSSQTEIRNITLEERAQRKGINEENISMGRTFTYEQYV